MKTNHSKKIISLLLSATMILLLAPISNYMYATPNQDNNVRVKIDVSSIAESNTAAEFQLTKENDNSFSQTWRQNFKTLELSNGIYTIFELTPPNGYQRADNVVFKVENGVVSINGKNLASKQESVSDENLYVYANDKKYPEDQYGSRYEANYYIKDKNSSNEGQWAFCLNGAGTYHPPLGDSEENKTSVTWQQIKNINDFTGYVENINNDGIKRTVYVGLNMNRFKPADMPEYRFREAIQRTLWYYTDGEDYKINLYDRETNFAESIINNTLNVVVPSNFKFSVYHTEYKTQGGRKLQNLISGEAFDVKHPKIVIEHEKTPEYPVYENGTLRTTVNVDNNSASENTALTIEINEDNTTKTIIDKVEYQNLKPNKRYTLKATLMKFDKNNVGNEVTTINDAFNTSDTGNGTVYMTFTDVNVESGYRYVVYEEAVSVDNFNFTEGNSTVTKQHKAEHKDKTDKAQTLIVTKEIPEYSDGTLRTTVNVDNNSANENTELTVEISENNPRKTIIDKVEYQNLKPNKRYTLKATLMKFDKNDVDPNSEGTVVATKNDAFNTTSTGNGRVSMKFENQLIEDAYRYVVYEEAVSIDSFEFKEGNSTVTKQHKAIHKDKTDKAQTFIVKQIPEYSEGSLGTTVSVDNQKSSSSKELEVKINGDSATKNIIDYVEYKNLKPNEQYKLTASLVEIKDNNAKIINTITGNFTTSDSGSGNDRMTFKNQTIKAGYKYVVYEKAESHKEFKYSENGRFVYKKHVAIHENLDDKAQTFIVEKEDDVYVAPEIATTVSVNGTPSNSEKELTVVVDGSAIKTIIDTVDYFNLKANEKYILSGRLMEIPKQGNPIQKAVKSIEILPTSADGSAEITFENVTIESGKKYVVFENIESKKEFPYKGGNRKHTATHEDVNDKAQTFIVTKEKPEYVAPEISTTVKVNNQPSNKNKALTIEIKGETATKTVVDTVDYKNLKANEKYTLSGRLMEVAADGSTKEKATASVEVVPQSSNGSAEVIFKNVTVEAGKNYVVFENIESEKEFDYKDGKRKDTAEHADVNDKAQTFVVEQGKPEYIAPEIATTVSVDGESSSKEKELTIAVDGKATKTVIDTVNYKNLKVDEKYTLYGKLMEVYDDGRTKKVASTNVKVVPTNVEGEAIVRFENVTIEVGKKYVVFENIVSEKEFDYADITRKDTAKHEDVNDKAQTFVVIKKEETTAEKPEYVAPEIATTVSVDGKDSNKEKELTVVVDKEATKTVVDTVDYKGLKVGEKYTLSGRLMEILADGSTKEVAEASVKVVPTNTNGSAEVRFENVTIEAGKKYVVFENIESENEFVYKDGKHKDSAKHEDVNDKAQTFNVEKGIPEYIAPKIKTTVKVDNKASSDEKELSILVDGTENKTIIDTVDYENLKVNEKYTLSGRLMEVLADGKTKEVAKSSVEVVPTSSKGSANVVFENVKVEAGKKYVVFENIESEKEFVYKDGKHKDSAKHENINDKAQTFTVEQGKPEYTEPKIATTVEVDKKTASKEKELTVIIASNSASKRIIDTVNYENLKVGEKYILSGRLMEVLNDGKTKEIAKTSVEVIPTNPNDSASVNFGMQKIEDGKKYVVFENIESEKEFVYKDGKHKDSAKHEDINDKAQTFIVEKKSSPSYTGSYYPPTITDTKEDPKKEDTEDKKEDKKKEEPKKEDKEKENNKKEDPEENKKEDPQSDPIKDPVIENTSDEKINSDIEEDDPILDPVIENKETPRNEADNILTDTNKVKHKVKIDPKKVFENSTNKRIRIYDKNRNLIKEFETDEIVDLELPEGEYIMEEVVPLGSLEGRKIPFKVNEDGDIEFDEEIPLGTVLPKTGDGLNNIHLLLIALSLSSMMILSGRKLRKN